jgi:hypothetical protein
VAAKGSGRAASPFRPPADSPLATSVVLKRLAMLWDVASDKRGESIPMSELAKRAEVSNKTLSDWSNGKTLPRDLDFLTCVGDVLAQWAGMDEFTQSQWSPLLDADRAHLRGSNQGDDVKAEPERAYLAIVQQIAPPVLMERTAELSELAEFCLAPADDSYGWWQAGPMAGKTGLLSTFVVNPPPEVAAEVDIVSFFITSQLRGQNSLESFVPALAGQLAELLGESQPQLPLSQDGPLLHLLSRAAQACRDAGRRLVLVVDGLDEDAGVTIGRDIFSIAGVLPVSPPAGMRIIVASRPSPPLPADVGANHPLCERRVIRQLSASSHARKVGLLGRKEIRRLLRGEPVERDILGLLAVAGGGLTRRDLADLTKTPLSAVEDILDGASPGRTFECRSSLFNPASSSHDVYLLGHREFTVAATDLLSDRLDSYFRLLHTWAADWHDRGWPSATPEYLAGGYFQLLEGTKEVALISKFARDMGRHDWMLRLTGGDAAGLAETSVALGRIAQEPDPELSQMLALACHRDHLSGRNSHIPTGLPAVWARLGQLPRAKAAAESITSPDRQASALARNSVALAQTGQSKDAERAAEQAIATASSSSIQLFLRAETLAHVAGTLALAGQRRHAREAAEQAHAVVQSIDDGWARRRALSRVAVALAQGGLDEEGLAVARSISDQEEQASALARIAGVLAQDVRHQDAAAIALLITDPATRTGALAQVAAALVQAGQYEQAGETARRAMADAQSVTESYEGHTAALAQAAVVLARAGEGQHPPVVAELIARSGEQAVALVRAAEQLAQIDQQRLTDVSTLFETGYCKLFYLTAMRIALAQTAAALAIAGETPQAADVARTITDGASLLGETLAVIAMHTPDTAQAGAASQTFLLPSWLLVTALVAAAEEHRMIARKHLARSRSWDMVYDTAAYAEAGLLAEAAMALARAGEGHAAGQVASHAADIAQSITGTDPRSQSSTLAHVAEALAQTGHHRAAELVATQAANVARSVTEPFAQAGALADVAVALAENGQHQDAEALARQADAIAARADNDFSLALAGHPGSKLSALAKVTEALVRTGQHERAAATVQQAGAAAERAAFPGEEDHGRAEVAVALVQAGLDQRAEETLGQIDNLGVKALALAEVAVALAQADRHQRATEVATQAREAVQSIDEPETRAQTLATAAEALALAGRDREAQATAQQAETAAKEITDPYWRAVVLARAGLALALAGRDREAQATAQQAEIFAEKITHPASQGRARAAVAMALAWAGHASARHVTAQACADGDWADAIRPVFLLEPYAYRTLADTLREQQ